MKLAKRRYPKTPLLVAIAITLLLSGIGYQRYSQSIAEATIQTTLKVADGSQQSVDIAWPIARQSSFGTVEDGVLVSSPNQQVLPTASTAKLITALTVLKAKPLKLGETGPLLTITSDDMALYDRYFAIGGSLVAIKPGDKMTQYHMLQAVLIRSSNSLADTLAVWAYGSLENYRQAAQELVDELGMNDTTVGPDASGLSTITSSTATDLVRLGIAAMQNDVIREIVGQTNFSSDREGTKPNTNWMLGQDDIIGIKTGNLPQIGGVFVLAKTYTPEGQPPMTMVAAVQGAATTRDAVALSNQLADAAKPLFTNQTIVTAGTPVANISTPWGETSQAATEKDVTHFGWKYATITPKVKLTKQPPFNKGDVIGTINTDDSRVNLVATETIDPPSWWWRIKTSR